MKLYTMFGQRKQSYEGEHAPEVLLCWDEYTVEENPEGWDEACVEAREKNHDSFDAIRVIVVDVDGDAVDKLLNETPEITGGVATYD